VPAPVVLAEVVRSGFVEGRHHGSVVALDADGSPAFSAGDVTSPIFPRSSNKPMQAVGMLRAGLDLDGELLALASASHSGEPFHIDGVRRILARAGLDESDLQTPPDLPIDDAARITHLAGGGGPEPVLMNCSGKHAAMLATCVVAAWSTGDYLDPAHPLQLSLRETLADLAGEPVAATGVDGCGAPLYAVSLTGLACAFRAVATAAPDTPEGRVAAAIRAYPTWLSGTHRDTAALVGGLRGLVAKEGAEGVYAAALPDGRAVALKIDDGAQRARPPVMVAALRRLGVEAPVLDELATTAVLGGGEPVGAVRFVGW
jgi:L-asparaginase II